MNEYYDSEVDKVNKPSKPLPSGEVDRNRVLLLGYGLISISFFTTAGLAAFFNLIYLLGVLGHTTSAVYNILRKDVVGNGCMAVTYGIGAFLSLYPEHLLFCLPFALFTLAHNLNNQYQDYEAEKTAGVVTVPQQLGAAGTFLLSETLLFISFYGFNELFLATGYLPLLIFMVVTVTTVVSSASMLIEREKAHFLIENVARRLGRFLLLTGFLAMLVF